MNESVRYSTPIDLTEQAEYDDVVIKMSDGNFLVTLNHFRSACFAAIKYDYQSRLKNNLSGFSISNT